jgi:hypothetical protein
MLHIARKQGFWCWIDMRMVEAFQGILGNRLFVLTPAVKRGPRDGTRFEEPRGEFGLTPSTRCSRSKTKHCGFLMS